MNPTSLILGAFAILLVYNKFFGQSKEDKEQEERVKDELEQEANEIEEELKTTRPTWPLSKYPEYANSIWSQYDAMFPSFLAVSKVFEHIINDIDYELLDKAYGYRDGMNMPTAIRDCFGMTKVNQINNMLRLNNVKYRI